MTKTTENIDPITKELKEVMQETKKILEIINNKITTEDNPLKAGGTGDLHLASNEYITENKAISIENSIVSQTMQNRATLIGNAIAQLGKAMTLGDGDEKQKDYLMRMVATDLFVEKAQRFLTERSDQSFKFGHIASFAIVPILIIAVCLVYISIQHELLPKDINGYILFLRLVQASTLATFVLVAVYILYDFARAFYHEGTRLRERRHALRFGRLYVYLKKDKFDIKEFEEIVDWNRDTTTVFQQLKNISTESLLVKLFSRSTDAIREFFDRIVFLRTQLDRISPKKENDKEPPST